jgi:hypothetical protein
MSLRPASSAWKTSSSFVLAASALLLDEGLAVLARSQLFLEVVGVEVADGGEISVGAGVDVLLYDLAGLLLVGFSAPGEGYEGCGAGDDCQQAREQDRPDATTARPSLHARLAPD